MYFRAKVEDGCIKIPEDLLMFFETGDEVAVTTFGVTSHVHGNTHIDRSSLTLEDMSRFFNAIELDPEDAKYNREELHRRGSSIS